MQLPRGLQCLEDALRSARGERHAGAGRRVEEVERHARNVVQHACQAAKDLALAERVLDGVDAIRLGLNPQHVLVVIVDVGGQPAPAPVVVVAFQGVQIGLDGLPVGPALGKSHSAAPSVNAAASRSIDI